MNQLVIDANVLEHANNTAEPRQESSIKLIEHLLASDELIYVDQGFDVSEAANRSSIWSEYLKRLPQGMLGRVLITELAISHRIREHPNSVDHAIRKKIVKTVRKPMDGLYLKIASKTQDRLFISHDFEDFDIRKRKYFKKEIKVLVIEASDYLDEW